MIVRTFRVDVLALALVAACASKSPAPGSDSLGALPGDGGAGAGAGSSSSGGPSAAPDAAPADAAVPDAEPPPEPYVPFDVNHVLSTGQSNSVANGGVPVLSASQPYANLMFDSGVMTGSQCDGNGCKTYQKPAAFVPLVEGDTFFYPVETMSSGLANEIAGIAKRAGMTHDVLVSLHGRSGNNYMCLRKGGCDWWQEQHYVKPFDDGMMQVADAKALATAAGKSYVVRAVTAVHGENDHYAYESGTSTFPMPRTDGQGTIDDYADALLEWQRDYEASVRAITGQTQHVPLFVSQYSHWNNTPHTKIAFMQLDAHLRSQGRVIVVGPTYALGYDIHCLHFTNHGERMLGEYFAKAYARVILEGRRWEPLRPIEVTHDGAVIRARFLVPKPPLVFDTNFVDDPGNYGFEMSEGEPAITKVEITGPDTVAVTLAAAPSPNAHLRYAYTFGGCAGPRTIARGNLRDSDATPSENGYALFNWSVHFDMPVK